MHRPTSCSSLALGIPKNGQMSNQEDCKVCGYLNQSALLEVSNVNKEEKYACNFFVWNNHASICSGSSIQITESQNINFLLAEYCKELRLTQRGRTFSVGCSIQIIGHHKM
jgi:hypothetical protein